MAKETPAAETATETTATGYQMPSAQTIADWKSKYAGVHKLWVIHPVSKERHYAFVAQPSMVDMQRAQASEKKKPLTFAQSIFENCKLQVDPAILTNESLLMGIYKEIDEVIEIAESGSEKL